MVAATIEQIIRLLEAKGRLHIQEFFLEVTGVCSTSLTMPGGAHFEKVGFFCSFQAFGHFRMCTVVTHLEFVSKRYQVLVSVH